ncbi:uncharacterized protein LOC110450528 [Mizuhopecten yessoensis]|uniref:uncharacterized protein LOC110450528 n=1 Tax=Mizuhopecten yessoensis TaxID=6573 RepID=UPI000B45F3BC|nr:uncharacterized protein LOC110450528 [Mizuhopecten yessoensis]
MMELFYAAVVLLVYQTVFTVRADLCTSDQCSMNGQCYDVGKRWKYTCIKYKCVNIEGKPVAQEKNIRCEWQNGRCKRIGTTKTSECTTFKCMKDQNEKYAFSPIKTGCKVNGKCFKPEAEIRFRNRPPCFCTSDAQLICAVH